LKPLLSFVQSEADDGGTLVRRLFEWVAPSGGDEALDDRAARSLVCFVAGDSYFAVADPYYCVNVMVREKPETSEETLLRFNCKMALLWSPVVQVSFLGDANISLGDAKSSLSDANISLGDAKSSLGDADISLGDAKS
jgi:hypothetical protein